MATEAKVRVRIDTKQAKKGLRDLGKEGAAAAGRIGRDAGGRAGGGLRKGFMLGAGLGLGVKAARAIEAGSIGDVAGEFIAGPAAAFDLAVSAPEARAKKAARQEVSASLAEITGRTKNTSDAVAVYNNILPRHLARTQGAALIQAALTDGDPAVKEAEDINKFSDQVIDALFGGIKRIIEAIGSFTAR